MPTRTAEKTRPKKLILKKISPSTNKKISSSEKASTRASASKPVTPRAKKSVSTPPQKPTNTKRPAKSTPVKSTKAIPENRVIATDNPNLLDPERDGTKKISGMSYRQISEQLGFGIGTEQFLAAIELLKGGQTRSDINDRVKALLPETTQNGTPKQVTNLVSGVLNKMITNGFEVQGSYKIVQVKGSSTK